MTSVDLALIGWLVLSTLLGLYWGLLRQLLALIGLVAGILVARRLGPEVGGWLTSFLSSDQLAGVLGFVLVLIAVSGLASLIASALRLFVGLLFLGRLDHVLGAILGLILAIMLSVVMIAAATTLADSSLAQAVRRSQVAALLTTNFGGVLWLLDAPMQSAARDAFFTK